MKATVKRVKLDQRLLVALTKQDSRVLEALAERDGVSQAGILRTLLRSRARELGLISPDKRGTEG